MTRIPLRSKLFPWILVIPTLLSASLNCRADESSTNTAPSAKASEDAESDDADFIWEIDPEWTAERGPGKTKTRIAEMLIGHGCTTPEDAVLGLDFTKLAKGPTIRKIQFWGWPRTESDLERYLGLLAHVKGLEELEFEFMSSNAATLDLLDNLKDLRRLHLVEVSYPTDTPHEFSDRIFEPLSRLRCLEELSLWGPSIHGKGLAKLSAIKSLRSLDLSGVSIEDSAIEELAAIRNLKTLDLSVGTADELRHLGTLPTLKSIALPEATPEILDVLTTWPQLEQLTFNTASMSDAALEKLATLSQVHALRINGRYAEKYSDKFLLVLPCMDSLVELSLPNVRDKDVASIAKCTQLRRLVLLRSLITAEGLSLLKPLDNLQELELDEPYSGGGLLITSKEISELAQFRSLRKLHLSSFEITEKAWGQLDKLNQLEAFSTKYRWVGDANEKSTFKKPSFEPISSMKQLKELEINGMPESLALLRRLKNLERLHLVNTSITELTATRIMDALPPRAVLKYDSRVDVDSIFDSYSK